MLIHLVDVEIFHWISANHNGDHHGYYHPLATMDLKNAKFNGNPPSSCRDFSVRDKMAKRQTNIVNVTKNHPDIDIYTETTFF